MGNVLVKEETLRQIADAIREKRGIISRYKPSEMPGAIRDITTYTNAGADTDKAVRFYDYEGTLLYSYSLKEISELTELPPLPERTGLTCQGWNWTLEQIQREGKETEIGAIYITDDGATRIYVDLVDGALSPYLCFAQITANSVKVDWGDGSELETTETCGSNIPVNMQHHYEKAGSYVIRLIPDEGAVINFLGSSSMSYILRESITTSRAQRVYQSAIKKIELGSCIDIIDDYAFYRCGFTSINLPRGIDIRRAFDEVCYVKTLILPDGLTVGKTSMFTRCYELEKLILPYGIRVLGESMISYGNKLKSLVMPNSITSLGASLFHTSMNLEKVILSNNITVAGNSVFYGCESLKEIVIPDSVLTVGTRFLYGCTLLKKVKLSANLIELPDYMFNNCRYLTRIEIPEGITKIGTSCFEYCFALGEIVIPKSVTTIMARAFYGTYGIQNYYLRPTTPPTLNANSAFYGIEEGNKIYVPRGCLEVYQTAEYWSEYADYMVEMEE